ncbi:uncharacterized protein LOC119729683 isoform X2 [Patiria miniata]|uniref:Uncharacterized protein n=1 Tax=Patiria miniata TaxID=46514 RepID=A0A914A377_PATMI|nr:uncharacterized protein LOC119729683 isoform X2 [Patiria miniata]
MSTSENEKCSIGEALAIYSAALSTINFIALLVVTVGVAVFLWRHRRQEGKSSERIHRKESSNGFAISVQEQPGPGFESSIPLLTNQREPEEVSITIQPAQIEEPQVQERPRVKQSKTQAKTPEQRGSDERTAPTMGATSGKIRRSLTLSLPRAPRRKPVIEPKPIKEAKPAGHHQNMKMITSQLSSTEKFQRLSSESSELRPDAAEREPQEPRRGAATVQKPGRGRGNEYQMTVLVKESSRDTVSKQDNSPYYHKVMQGACDDAEGEEQDEGCGLRDTRSMSTPAYGFPLKKTTEKKSGTVKKQTKPQSDPKKTWETDDYEPVQQDPMLLKQHSVVVAAEEQGQYSKLNRKEMVKENTVFVPREGYDHLSAPEKENVAPVLYGLFPESDTN